LIPAATGLFLPAVSATDRPDETALAAFWSGPVFEVLDPPASQSALGKLVEQLDLAHGNGGAFFLSFRFLGSPGSAGDWFVSRNLFVESGFFEHLLTSSAFLGLFEPGAMPAHQDPMGWGFGNPYALAGEWAFAIKTGGAVRYTHPAGAEAMRIAEAARQELFGDRYEDQWVFSCTKAWNDWFHGLHWDKTWVGFDQLTRQAWVLGTTDSD
jgi:hypothetical protein